MRGPIKAARSSSRLRGLKGLGAAAAAGDADLDFDDGEDTFQDLTGKRRFASLYVLGARVRGPTTTLHSRPSWLLGLGFDVLGGFVWAYT